MGMSASQARFLALTARKNNVEYEGQQINQQRTTLSNQSASYYAELCNMVVPTPPSIDNYTKICYTFDDGALNNTITAMIAKGGNEYSINYIQQWQDDYSIVSAASSIVTKDENLVGRKLSDDEKANLNYYKVGADGELQQIYKHTDKKFYTQVKGNGQLVDVADEKDLIMCLEIDKSQASAEKAVTLVIIDEAGNYMTEPKGASPYQVGDAILRKLGEGTKYDSYLSTLSEEDQKKLLEEEKLYISMLNERVYGNSNSGNQWYVRYVKNTTTGAYTPYFYEASDLEKESNYTNDVANKNMNCYSLGSTTKTKEVVNAVGMVQKDTSGRYISISLYKTDANGNKLNAKGEIAEKSLTDSTPVYTTYTLVTNTITDEDAYNDAMNQYNFEQYKYDQKIQAINSKIEVIQQQDKSLELELKQLDTEENAISTELDAVKKVIQKNIESSFKTFNA